MSVYKRKGSPHWWINISVAGRKTRRSTGTEDRKQAEEYEATERDRLWRVHKLGDRSAIRFTEAAAEWLAKLPEKSRYKEESIVRWFEGEIGEEQIGAIDRDAVLELRESLVDAGKKPARIDRYLANLRAILNLAVDHGHIEASPPVPMYNRKKRGIRWLTEAEFKALKRELPEHLALAAEFAVYSGLRMRSMLGLTWDRIDLRRGRMWIPGEQMKGKEDHGLPVSKALKRILRSLKSLNPKGAHVFQYEDRPVDDCNTKAFQEAAKRAGVAPLRWHDLRHTFASWAVQRGVTLQELMQLGNWKSFSMVLRYAHLAPDHLRQAAEKIARSERTHGKKIRQRK